MFGTRARMKGGRGRGPGDGVYHSLSFTLSLPRFGRLAPQYFPVEYIGERGKGRECAKVAGIGDGRQRNFGKRGYFYDVRAGRGYPKSTQLY